MQLCCSDAALWHRACGTALMSTAAVALFGELEDAEILQSSCEACPCWVSLPDSSQRVYMVYNPDLRDSVRAGAVFSLSPALWQYRVRPLSHCTQDLVLFLYPGLQGKAGVNISFSHKAPVRQGLQISLNRTTAPTRRLFALPSSHVTFLWVQPSLSTFSPSKARALYLLSIFPWLCGFHSWLQLSAAVSAHIIWETNTKQVVLEAPSHFCQPFPNNNS